MSPSTKTWLHTIAAAFISTFATSASGMLALPTVFNFTHDGLMNVLKVAAVPALIAVLTYLKTSPLPPLNQTVEVSHAVVDSGGTATVDSAKTTTGVTQ